jgi:enamine deaminase RidA (YjgF/YER057c/UK114 family)
MPGISHFNPPELPAPSGYSHASAGSGELVFLAGQVGSDRSGKIQDPGDIAAQFGLAIRNLGIALEGSGCAPDDVVKVTYLVTDVAAYRAAAKEIGGHYRAVFGRHFPASTLLEVKGLYDPEAMVEIEAVAVRSS